MLADAHVDVIAWSGTAAGWLGFETDQRLIERIRERTGIAATTAVLSLNQLLALRSVKRLGLVTPYTADVQARIEANYRQLGIEVVVPSRHLGITVNHDFALIEPDTLMDLVREVAGQQPDAIATYCTNLFAAPMAEAVEKEFGVPFLDTVSTTVWGQLRAAGADPDQVRGWGRLFAER